MSGDGYLLYKLRYKGNQPESVGDEEGDGEEKVNVLTNKIVPAVFHDLIGYISENLEGDSVEGNIMNIPRVDEWIQRFINLLIVKAYHGGGHKKE